MDTNQYLVIMDVSQKQRYIFGSNRLKENVGASIVIAQMTNTIPNKAFLWYYESRKEELETLKLKSIEAIEPYLAEARQYDGGGKSVFLFPTEHHAKLFIKIVSTYALQFYFGIELFFAMQKVETVNKLSDIENLYKKLEDKKSFRRQSFRLHGIGLNEKCPSTSLPVHIVRENMGLNDDVVRAAKKYENILKNNINRTDSKEKIDTYGKDGFNLEVYTKLAALEDEETSEEEISFKRFLTNKAEYAFPLDLENLGGTKDEKNKIAIISIDGNGMGKRIESIQELVKENREMDYLKALKEFSEFITDVYNQSIKNAVKEVEDAWNNTSQKGGLGEKLDLKTNRDIKFLPIRPLIAAGDDICFITEGRIGLSFAKIMLDQINKTSKQVIKNREKDIPWLTKVVSVEEGMHASAGVVICGIKYPFSRAYDLAEDLLKVGKTKLATDPSLKISEGSNDHIDASMIDFHVAMGEIEESLSMEREKRAISEGMQTVKPYILKHDESPFSFEKFTKAMELLKKIMIDSEEGDNEKAKKAGKSQIKELAYYIRKGNDYAKSFINQSNRLDIKNFKELIGEKEDFSIILDAIEMLDLYEEIGGDNQCSTK